MDFSRRVALKGLFASGAMIAGSGMRPVRAGSATSVANTYLHLDNGLRAHIVPSQSRYISAALLLRSTEIRAEGGLAHLMEHTSFVGAAGPFAARSIKEMRQDYFQENNASTRPGMILWQVCFLPKYLDQALGLLAMTSLDQKFDVETVASEARVVQQELYLEKYDSKSGHRRLMGTALFGRSHPHGVNTTESEIEKAKTPPAALAAELRAYAQTIRLPGNMDLVLVGGLDPVLARAAVQRCFSPYPAASGPMMTIPAAPVTRSYRAFSAASPELRRPLSEVKIAWNTGISVKHPDANTVLTLSEYLNATIFERIRERHGDAYSPQASYQPDECSGVFEITIPSTEAPHKIERKVFEAIAELKAGIDARGLLRFRDRFELQRRKKAESSEAHAECLVQRIADGCSIYDLDLEPVTPEHVLAAARTHLPSYRGAYVKLALLGR